MLGEHVDLVAGDINGAAWRCSNRNNISTKEDTFGDCASSPPHTIMGTKVRFQDAGLMCAGSPSRPNPIGIGKFDFMVPFPFLMKL